MLVWSAALVVLVAGLLVPPAAQAEPAPGAAPTLVWGACDDPSLTHAKAECARLTVPLDHADPTGPTITLGVSRVRHRVPDSKYLGVMLTNPGGPGGDGRWMATLGSYVPNRVGRRFDWIGIDPRGVGSSRPAMTCDGDYFGLARPAYDPTTRRVERAWRDRVEGYADACGSAAAAPLLDHVKTTDTVADFEILREALGVEQVSLYGASYGSYLGQVYATLHPDRIDKLILDGVIDPRGVWYRSNLDQAPAFETAMGRFFAWIGRHDDVYRLGTSGKAVRAAYDREMARLTRHPRDGVGPAELNDAILGAGYNVYSWPSSARILQAIVNRDDARPARRAYRSDNPVGKGADNGYAMYLATQCTDAPWPTAWSRWRRDNIRLAAKAPYLTWGNAWYNAPCRTWPAAPGTPVSVSGQALASKVLLISEQYDAATPYAGALAARRLFPTASLIEGKGGSTHAAGLYGIGCVDDTIARYLATGRTPTRRPGNRADKVCPGLPAPGPGAITLARRPSAGHP